MSLGTFTRPTPPKQLYDLSNFARLTTETTTTNQGRIAIIGLRITITAATLMSQSVWSQIVFSQSVSVLNWFQAIWSSQQMYKIHNKQLCQRFHLRLCAHVRMRLPAVFRWKHLAFALQTFTLQCGNVCEKWLESACDHTSRRCNFRMNSQCDCAIVVPDVVYWKRRRDKRDYELIDIRALSCGMRCCSSKLRVESRAARVVAARSCVSTRYVIFGRVGGVKI